MGISSFGEEGAYIQNFTIVITHLATDNSVEFYAFLNSFSDSFKGNYKTQTVYGRMDPIVNYQGTTRKITFSFTVPAYSIEDAEANVSKLQQLIKFQYPTYNQGVEKSAEAGMSALNVSGMAAPPMCKVRFNNLINYYGEELHGYFDGVDFNPTNESGYFTTDDMRIFPKEFKISLNFNILHTSPLGWDAATNKWGTKLERDSNLDVNSQFPYGARPDPNQLKRNDFMYVDNNLSPYVSNATKQSATSEIDKAKTNMLEGK